MHRSTEVNISTFEEALDPAKKSRAVFRRVQKYWKKYSPLQEQYKSFRQSDVAFVLIIFFTC